VLRQPLLMLARSDKVKQVITGVPVSNGIVARYVPGESTDEAVRASGDLIASGLHVTLDFLGEDTSDREQADHTVAAYLDVLRALSEEGLSRNAEVSVKLSAIGQALPDEGEKVAVENARTICHAARNAGTTVTLDMEDHTTTDSTLGILRELRKDFPEISGTQLGVTVDVFNVFNYQNFGCFDTGFNSSTQGQATCVVSDPRRVQLGAEYNF